METMQSDLLKMMTTAMFVLLAVSVQGQGLVTTGSLHVGPGGAGLLEHANGGPTWSGGTLISVESNLGVGPVIHSFDESGVEMTPITFIVPEAKTVNVEGVVRGADGAYAVAGRASDLDRAYVPGQAPRDGRLGGFVSWISPDRQTVKTTRTFPYIPHMVAIAPDRSIWTVGAETVNGAESNPAVDRSRGVVRHFDTTGAQIGSFLPRSQVFGGKWLGLPQGYIASSGDRLGWYARVAQVYMEIPFDGKITTFPGIAQPSSHWTVTGLALMGDSNVIVSAQFSDPNSHREALYRLDRATKTWSEIPTPSGTKAYIQGGDGKRALLQGTTWGTYQWVRLGE